MSKGKYAISILHAVACNSGKSKNTRPPDVSVACLTLFLMSSSIDPTTLKEIKGDLQLIFWRHGHRYLDLFFFPFTSKRYLLALLYFA
jgi:hypothetical protein